MSEAKYERTRTAPFDHRPLAKGVHVADYVIDGVLGQGGFGITYRAVDRHLDRQVAVKEFFPVNLACRDAKGAVVCADASDEAEFASRRDAFLTEARTLARFDHPNIVRVLSIFQARGTAYIVMAYEHGHSLSQLYRTGRMNEEALRAIALELADGLQHLHRVDLIHRDIKPENIYVRDDGSPILLDFGAARRATGLGPGSMTCMVSPGYTPFEQLAQAREGFTQGPWTDIYALSATLYRGVCGQKPVNANTRAGALLNGKPDPLRPARERAHAGYSVSFLRAIDAGLAFKPSDRPGTLHEWCSLLFTAAPQTRRSNLSSSARHRRSRTFGLRFTRPKTTIGLRRAGGGRARRIAILASMAGFAFTPPAALYDRIDPSHLPDSASTAAALASAEPIAVRIDWAAKQLQSTHSRAATGRQEEDAAPPLLSISSPVAAHGRLETGKHEIAQATPASDQRLRREQRGIETAVIKTAAAVPNTRKIVQDLLVRAEADLAAYRLTSPHGNNALQRFDEVLALDPGNAVALVGRERIVTRYLELVEVKHRQSRFGMARMYLARAQSLKPGSAKIATARKRIARAERLERTFEPVRPAERPAVSPVKPRTLTRAVVVNVQAPPNPKPRKAPVGCPLSRSRS